MQGIFVASPFTSPDAAAVRPKRPPGAAVEKIGRSSRATESGGGWRRGCSAGA